MAQPGRLAADANPRFAGAGIDRGRPLSFRLDGRIIEGFAGDTVLSAALAAGIDTVGTLAGQAMGLDERFAPPVQVRGASGGPDDALPMARTPALDGLDLIVHLSARLRQHPAVEHLLGAGWRSGRSLGVRLDGRTGLADPGFSASPRRQATADLVVIGGGLAGMSAALAAGETGARVVLIERRPALGGAARFFGSVEDEDSPEITIERLTAALGGLPNVQVFCRAEAFAIAGNSVHLDMVEVVDGRPARLFTAVAAPRIVLACGAVERLPIFPGNRLPGVVGAATAFERAQSFGLWPGRRALLGTATSVAYRAAMEAKNAGIAVERIVDVRLDPRSHFIEFSKAYGIQLSRGMRPVEARAMSGGRGLAVQFASAVGGGAERPTEQFSTDRLLLSGGWQPDLALWHMAGGASRWEAERGRLVATGDLPGIRLAGAVAGVGRASACLASGAAATAALFGRVAPEIVDPPPDGGHESQDAATPIAPQQAGVYGTAFLDGGGSLTRRPGAGRGRLSWNRAAPRNFAQNARPSVADTAAAIQLGEMTPADAAIIASERSVAPAIFGVAGPDSMPPQAAIPVSGAPPAYLEGRFGSDPTIWLVAAADGRRFEVGSLIFINSDAAPPSEAIGVVFAATADPRGGGIALIGPLWRAGSRIVVRDGFGPLAALLFEAPAPEVAASAEPEPGRPDAETTSPPSLAAPTAPERAAEPANAPADPSG